MSLLSALASLLLLMPQLADEPRIGPLPRPPAEAGVGRLLARTTAETVGGGSVSLAPRGTEQATVIALTSTTCPLSAKFAPLLGRLSSAEAACDVRWIFVDVTGSSSVEEFTDFAERAGFTGDLVHDPDLALAWALGCESTAETILVDARSTIRYRGCVDDRYGLGYARDEPRMTPLLDALDSVLSGRSVELPATTAPGCELTPDVNLQAETAPTYHGTISRIVQANCLECHRSGGAAPFPLETAEQVIANAGMIARVVERRTMPPWHAGDAHRDPYGVFANDRSLPDQDIAAIRAWVDGGRPLGDPEVAPLPREFRSGWSIGTPDLVVRIPEPVAVKAEGQMPYVDIEVDPGIEQDLWVRGWEVLPTDRSVVHHALVFLVEPGRRGRFGPTDGFLGVYVPGNGYALYGDGQAKVIPAGSRIHFQIHYAPNGVATTDQLAIGLRLAAEPPRELIQTIGIADTRLRIPPGASDHEETAVLRVPEDVRVLSVTPHMHIRGAGFECTVVDPDGVRSTLLDVPRYDFNWQLSYRYADPPLLLSGSTVRVTGVFDNSRGNPGNPDPTSQVRWGKQTDDEMLIGYVEYWVDDPDVDPEAVRSGHDDDLVREQVRRLMARWDSDGDGRVVLSEVPDSQKPRFDMVDLDGDGAITESEFVTVMRRFLD